MCAAKTGSVILLTVISQQISPLPLLSRITTVPPDAVRYAQGHALALPERVLFWPARRDSNPRPTDPKSVALIH